MSVRAIQARIACDLHTLERLWRTHKVFNEKLPELLTVLFRMRRGQCGTTKCERELYQVIGHFISARSSRDAWYLFNSISKKNWRSKTAEKMTAAVINPGGQEIEISGAVWAERAAALTREGKFIYDKPQWSPQNRPFVDGSKPAIRLLTPDGDFGAPHSCSFLWFLWASQLSQENLAPGSPRNGDLELGRPTASPVLSFFRRILLFAVVLPAED